MESYKSGQRFIIRDKEGRISSGKSTVVSKSIFPKMMISRQTNTAFFDLPGFGDTRGPAVELANAVFIKRVADRARRVKIIFVVNHSSLRSGEFRTDFKNLLEHISSFLKSPTKYRPAVAIIANKVDLDIPSSTIIPSVARFLKNARESLALIFDDETTRKNTRTLIDALLQKDRKRKFYIRIGYMRQPAQEGQLSEIPAFKSTKIALTRILLNNTRFVAKAKNDFGISVAPSTKLFVRNAVGHLYASMGLLTEELSDEIRKYFMNKFALASNVYILIRDFRANLIYLQNKTAAISTVISRSFGQGQNGKQQTRQELLELLQDISHGIRLNDPDQILYENMGRSLEHLDFLEPLLVDENKAEANHISQRVLESWTSPIKQALSDVENTIYSIGQAINNVVAASTALAESELKSLYGSEIENMYDIISASEHESQVQNNDLQREKKDEKNEVQEFLEDMKKDSKLLEDLVKKLLGVKSINQFFNESLRGIEGLKVVTPPSNLLHMLTLPGEGQLRENEEEEDFSLGDLKARPSPYTPALWVSPLEDLQSYLEEAVITMEATLKDSKRDDEVDRLRDQLEGGQRQVAVVDGNQVEEEEEQDQ